jgi:hypothetical protein
MKKILLTLLFLFYISIQIFGAEYLKIKFKSKASIAASKAQGPFILLNFQDVRLNAVFLAYTITDYNREYPIADSFPDNLLPAVRLRLFYRVRISEKQKIKELKAKIDALKSPDIDTVMETNDPISLTTPDDYYNCFTCGGWPQASNHLDLINAQGAWDITTGLSCIKIGIVDENFQQHEDLDSKVITTSRTASIAPLTTYMPSTHGVNVAGMAGAITNNNTGISSLGYNTSLSYYDIGYNGILNALYDRCQVVNCSWFDHYSSSLEQPPSDVNDILYVAHFLRITIVAAAGNNNSGTPTDYFYPASYDGVISVTSVGSQFDVGDPNNANWKDCHRQFTDPNYYRYNETHQHNDRVDICAPGYWIETTARNNAYGNTGGTSFAAPQVSAAAALLYSINPYFTTEEIEAYLKNNAANIYGVHDNYLWTGMLGAGRLDAGASLQAALNNAYTGNYCNTAARATYVTAALESFYNQNKKEQLKIYPNPANDIISVTYDLLDKNPITIKVMNSVGVVVKSIQKNSDKQALGKTEIFVKDLSDGLYYVVVRQGTKVYTKNFLKMQQ